MFKYILKRLLQLIPILIGITFLSFAMMRLAGGDAVTYMYENAGSAVSQEVIDETRKEYGLDQPFLVQYAKWFAGMATGDMGKSYEAKREVYETFIEKLPATILLTVSSLYSHIGRNMASRRARLFNSAIFSLHWLKYRSDFSIRWDALESPFAAVWVASIH